MRPRALLNLIPNLLSPQKTRKWRLGTILAGLTVSGSIPLVKVSVKENEVPTEKNSSRYKGKLYIKFKLKD